MVEAAWQSDMGTLKQRICVIGAGPTGLGALKVISDAPAYKQELWEPVVFEAREALGGVWCVATLLTQRGLV